MVLTNVIRGGYSERSHLPTLLLIGAFLSLFIHRLMSMTHLLCIDFEAAAHVESHV